MTRAEYMKDPFARRGLQGYLFQTGQPKEVRDAFLAAIGVNDGEIGQGLEQIDPLAPNTRGG